MRTLVTFGLGALTMYLLDPEQGRTRRALLRDQLKNAKRQLPDLRTRLESAKASETPESAHQLGR
jgi:hypothetical protein